MFQDQVFDRIGTRIVDIRAWSYSSNPSFSFHYFGNSDVCQRIRTELSTRLIPSNEEFGEFFRRYGGHFAGIIETESEVIGFVDTIRSVPVFYRVDGREILVSNSARSLCEAHLTSDYCGDGLNDLVGGGYVTGKDTVIKNVFQLRIGELIRLDKCTGKVRLFRYYRYLPRCDLGVGVDTLKRNLGVVIDDIFSDLAKDLSDRTIWVSLSGGLDSRLILSKLHEHGHKGLRAFSYGAKSNEDVRRAQIVASRLKIPWIYLPTRWKWFADDEVFRKLSAYWDYADGLASFPIGAWHEPLSQLVLRKHMTQSDIVINGQSGDFISGGHIPEVFREGTHRGSDLLDEIIRKHFALWVVPVLDIDLKRIRKRISEQLGVDESDYLSNFQAASLYETWEFEERQAKFVVNGQRLYDWHGLQWALPLWDFRLIEFFETVPLALKFEQTLFKDYLEDYNYFDLFGRALPEGDGLRIVERLVGISGSALKASGVVKWGNRLVKLSGYWGKYDYQYQMYGFRHFWTHVDHVTAPPQARGVTALGVAKWLQKNHLISN